MRREVIICLGLAAITLALFWPVHRHDFTNFDDREYVTENPVVQAGITWPGLRWAFGGSHASNWHPMTWLSHMLDCQMFGLKPGAHHLVNLGFHVANSLLLFLVLRRMTGAVWRSALVAALFAWHPLHVESVAWIAERKDLLSAFFFLLTIWAYARYVEVRSRGTGVLGPKIRAQGSRFEVQGSKLLFGTSGPRLPASCFYGLSLLLFTLGLMSKPMLVTLPCVLLLLDFWPLQRFQPSTLNSQLSTLCRLAQEKWPFFLLSAVSCFVTLRAQSGAMQPLDNLSLGSRLANALVAYARYLGKTLWPVNLATPYPYPGRWPLAEVLLAGALLAGLTLAALLLSRRRPVAATGWFWFLGMLVPVIGLVQVGEQSMADRYTYLPSIGLFVLLTWGASAAFARWRLPKAVCGLAAGAALLLCAWLTRNQVPVWQNSETLFRHAVTVTKDNWFAWFNLGVVLDNQGRVDEALADYRKAVALQPNYVEALLNIGATLANRKQFADAIPFFERALRQNPDSVDCHDNLGHVLLEVGQPGAAIPHLRQVVQHRPQDLDALNILAEALARAGQFEQAIATAQKARDLALASGQKALAAKNQRLLESYQSRQAAHAPAESPPASPRDH